MAGPLRFDDPRQERIHRRLGLLGDGPAAFFRDAVRIVNGQPELETSTHLVAHLLREIESALRHVLEPIAHHKARKRVRKKKTDAQKTIAADPAAAPNTLRAGSDTAHRDEILVILDTLHLPRDGEVAQAWLTLSEKSSGLAGRAHRRALERPRPMAPEFAELWEQTLGVLDAVLEQLEARYVDLHRAVDAILAKEVPSSQDLEILSQQLPNNLATRKYFFENLKHPGWLGPLADAGFFSDPPPASAPDEQGLIGFPWWPASEYLTLMAAVPEQQRRVLDVVLALPQIDNPRTTVAMTDIAIQLPSRLGAELAVRLVAGMSPISVDLMSEKIGQLIVRWANDGEPSAAVTILGGLLKAYGEMAGTRPSDGMADYLLAETVREHLPSVLRAAPDATIDILLDALGEALQHEMHFVTPHKPEDYSSMWRPTIAQDGYHHRNELGNLLVSAVRDAVIGQLNNDPSPAHVARWMEILEAREWSIFTRLAMHVASIFPEQARERVHRWLLDRDAFDQWSPDYRALFAHGYRALEPAAKATLLAWIAAGTDISAWPIDEQSDVPADEQRRRMLARWKLKRLSPINDDLDESLKRVVAELTASIEPSPPAGDDDDDEGGWIGPRSPLSIEELGSVEEIVRFLRDWVPPRGWKAPTPEGLSRALTAAVARDPARFARDASLFTTVEPTYVRSVIDGLRETLKSDSRFAWESVLGLSVWAVQQAREPLGTREGRDRDPGWSWTHRAVASLLREGLDATTNPIPYSLRKEVWAALEPITRDPDPAPPRDEGGGREDWFGTAINSVRGEAIIAAIRYAVWIRRCYEADGRAWTGLDSVPEVREVLEGHLNQATEGSPAIAAVYGQALRVLAYLDEKWLESQVGRIFSSEVERRPFKDAAWDAYLRFGDSWLGVLRFLAPLYEEAIDSLNAADEERPKPHDPDHQLARHVMQFLWNSGRQEPRLLAERLFARGGPGMRAAALDIVGRAVRRWPRSVPPEVYERLQAFWDSNINIVNASAVELGAFGAWLVSAKFDEQWVLTRALEIQRRGVALDSAHQLADFAATVLAQKDPVAAVRLIEGLIETQKEPWSVVGWRKAAATVLQTALSAQQPDAAAAARVVVSKLIARGHSQFKKLLDEGGTTKTDE